MNDPSCYVRSGDRPNETAVFGKLMTKIEGLDTYSHLVLEQFPKRERHLLCADIRICIANIQRHAITAWKRYHKKTLLQELDIEIEVLRCLIRKSLVMKHITPKRYEVWINHINEIGCMVGGWIKIQK